MRAAALMLIPVLLTTACDPSMGSETMRTAGAELNDVLPTVSVQDTEQTKIENATFREVFFTIWPEYRP